MIETRQNHFRRVIHMPLHTNVYLRVLDLRVETRQFHLVFVNTCIYRVSKHLAQIGTAKYSLETGASEVILFY